MYASQLQAIYGGDLDIITAGALLVNAPNFEASSLGEVGFPTGKIPQVMAVLAESREHPTTLERRILSDAYALAEFGAAGIMQIASRLVQHVPDPALILSNWLEHTVPTRIAALEFEASRLQAYRDLAFARLFVEKLRADPVLTPVPTQPYVIIEGISGAGKTTQVELLCEHYARMGVAAVSLHEPTTWLTKMRENLSRTYWNQTMQLLFLLTDRYVNVNRIIRQAQEANKPVIAARSYLSTMVYQVGEGGWLSTANIAYLHAALPQPTHLFLLHLTPGEALRRIQARHEASHSVLGEHETLTKLTLHSERYLSLKQFFPAMRVIDVEKDAPTTIHEQIWQAVTQSSS